MHRTKLLLAAMLIIQTGCGLSPPEPDAELQIADVTNSTIITPSIYNGYPISGLSGISGFTSSTWVYLLEYFYSSGDHLTITAHGGGDADLYVKRWSPPDVENFDCAPFVGDSSDERCVFPESIDSVQYFMNLNAFADYNGVTLHAFYSKQLLVGTGNAFLTGGGDLSRQIWWVDVPNGKSKLTVTLTFSSGSANTYGRFRDAPEIAHSLTGGAFASIYDCVGITSGNAKACNIVNPTPGRYYFLIAPSSSWTGTLQATLLAAR